MNEAGKLEMQAILLRLQGAEYDKQAETLHKGKFEGVQISVYWSRCAVGVSLLPSCKSICLRFRTGQRRLMASASFVCCG